MSSYNRYQDSSGNGNVPVTENEPFMNDPSWAFDSPPYTTYDVAPFFQDDWEPNQSTSMSTSGLPQQQQQPPVEPPQSSVNPVPATFSFTAGTNGPAMSAPTQAYMGPATMSTLTEAQRRNLQKIAMPSHLQYRSPKSEPSPESAGSRRKSPSMSPSDAHSQSSKTNNRKRKSSAEDDDEDEDELDEHHQPVKKTAHNMIEKRYRTNLNDKIAALRDSVPSLRIMSKSVKGEDTSGDREELHGLTPAHKLNKATVLSKATEYIHHLEKRNNRLMDEKYVMQQRIDAFEKLFMAGALDGGISPVQQQQQSPQYSQGANGFVHSPIVSASSHADPQGMIPVPEPMKRILAAQIAAGQPYAVPQQQFMGNPAVVRRQQIQQQQQQIQDGRWQARPYKLMVGSLAGLMLLEVVRETEQSNETPEGRGLFALPVQLLRFFTSSMNVNLMGYHLAADQVLFSLKVALLLCALWCAIFPSMFKRGPLNPKAPKQLQTALESAPSLASPIHVRRRAWLTAIQTVWVPRHNFVLEATALCLKALKLSLRNLIGVHGYQLLTGLTVEQEVARAKAWTIALDAQLAGGDVEINKGRLTLTLLASGTLPDTPLRLMLKALHIRVLLWEVGLTGLQLGLINTIASKIARAKWNEAKQLHKLLTQRRRAGQEQSDDDLPDHLAVLLEQDADDVFNASIVQRAHNLAWNRPTNHNAIGATDGMDVVVEDTAVRSPMDAVAAWWSSLTLSTALANSLLIREDQDGDITQLVEDGVTLAIRTAPVGSITQSRALVARAVLFNEKRGANIAAVIQAVGPLAASNTLNGGSDTPALTPPATPLPEIPASMLCEAEIYMSLQCAKAVAHLHRYAPPEEPINVYQIINEEIQVSNEMSLLGYTAAFTLMERLAGHEYAAEACSDALERLSGSLRIWTGKDCGLDSEVKQEIVERCIAVTRGVVGMDIESDTGYGSMSDSEGDCGHRSSMESEQFSVSAASESS